MAITEVKTPDLDGLVSRTRDQNVPIVRDVQTHHWKLVSVPAVKTVQKLRQIRRERERLTERGKTSASHCKTL